MNCWYMEYGRIKCIFEKDENTKKIHVSTGTLRLPVAGRFAIALHAFTFTPLFARIEAVQDA